VQRSESVAAIGTRCDRRVDTSVVVMCRHFGAHHDGPAAVLDTSDEPARDVLSEGTSGKKIPRISNEQTAVLIAR